MHIYIHIYISAIYQDMGQVFWVPILMDGLVIYSQNRPAKGPATGGPLLKGPSLTRRGRMKMYGVWNICTACEIQQIFSRLFWFWGLGLLQLHRHLPLLPVGPSVIFSPATSIFESLKKEPNVINTRRNWTNLKKMFNSTQSLTSSNHTIKWVCQDQHKHHHWTASKNYESSKPEATKCATAQAITNW